MGSIPVIEKLADYDVTLRFIDEHYKAEIAKLEARITEMRTVRELVSGFASKHGSDFLSQSLHIKFEEDVLV